MMAITTSNSIRVNPLFLLIPSHLLLAKFFSYLLLLLSYSCLVACQVIHYQWCSRAILIGIGDVS